MAEPFKTLGRLKQQALADVRELMLARGGLELDGGVLSGPEIAGWRFTLDVPGHPVAARLSLTSDFPFDAPRVTLEGGPYFLKFPHIDEKEKLCLNPIITSYSPAQPVEITRLILDQAVQLVADGLAEKNREDFVDEFRNYWDVYRATKQNRVRCLLERYDQTRLVRYWSGKNYWVFGESEKEINDWLDRVYRPEAKPKRTMHETVFAALPEPLYPDNYPRTNADFRRLAGADDLLSRVAPQEVRDLPVLFAFNGKAGPVLGGLRLGDPTAPAGAPFGKVRHGKADGFRPGQVPPNILLNRFFNSSQAIPLGVDRVDRKWLLERGGLGFDASLATREVAIVGCGSLGAAVALLLCQSGVGRLMLIDNQVYSWDNVARHILPGSYVGRPKDEALKEFLGEHAPGVAIRTGGFKTAERVIRDEHRSFSEIDLVISTTGDWGTESYINAVARTERVFPALVYGWTEPYGLAGHALVVSTQGGCLACGCDQTGLFQRRVIEWPKGQDLFKQAAGCSDLFQPYGSVDVAPIRGMIAEVALKVLRRQVPNSQLFTWIAETSRIAGLGGSLRNEWQERLAGSAGLRRFDEDWPPDQKCPLCSR